MAITDESAVQYLAGVCMSTYSDYVNLPYAVQISNLMSITAIRSNSFVLLALCLGLPCSFSSSTAEAQGGSLLYYCFVRHPVNDLGCTSGRFAGQQNRQGIHRLSGYLRLLRILSIWIYPLLLLWSLLSGGFFTILSMVFVHLKRKAESHSQSF